MGDQKLPFYAPINFTTFHAFKSLFPLFSDCERKNVCEVSERRDCVQVILLHDCEHLGIHGLYKLPVIIRRV